VTPTVYVPGVGFRSADALRMPERTIVRQGERAMAVMSVVSSEAGTELEFEVKDDRLDDDYCSGKVQHGSLVNVDVRLLDEHGRRYARSSRGEGFGFGQHAFGSFSRRCCFEPLHPDARRVVLEVDGAFGQWTVPVDVVPITDTGVAPQKTVDRATTKHGITLRLVGIAVREEDTFVELDATWTAPIAAIHGIGAMIQRQGDDRLVLIDRQGRRYDEELSRETTQRPFDKRERTTAKFPALPPDATELNLIVPAVVVEDSDAALEFALPIQDAREVRFGPYPMRLGPAGLVHDLLQEPGKPPGYGLRFAIGPLGWHEDRRVLGPMRISVDGVEHSCGYGWGWHPEPGMRSYTVDLKAGEEPKIITLARPLVSIRGPWEIPFEP
jgi:hypothetical protein